MNNLKRSNQEEFDLGYNAIFGMVKQLDCYPSKTLEGETVRVLLPYRFLQ